MHRAGCNSGCICTRQTVKKTRRAREGRSPFELSIVPGGMYGGHGTVFASENPIFQRKKRFLAGSAPEKSSIFSGDWRGWQWRGSLLPRPPACQNFFDKLSSPFRGAFRDSKPFMPRLKGPQRGRQAPSKAPSHLNVWRMGACAVRRQQVRAGSARSS